MLAASALAAALTVAAADAPAAPAAVAAADVDVASYVDEGVALDTLGVLLQRAREAGRVALYVDDVDDVRRVSLERTLLRALRDRRQEDVVSPSLVKATMNAAALAALKGGDAGALPGLAADHVIVGVVTQASTGATLELRLLYTQTGEVLSTASLAVAQAAPSSTASAHDVRTGAADIADVLAEAVEARGVDVRSHRVAVAPTTAAGAAKEARLDRFLQTELAAALRRRGFLVVERNQLSAALDQLSIQELGTERVADVGALLGAQSIVLSSVVDAADRYVVTARLVGVDTGEVTGAASAKVIRDDVVSLAAVETRTPVEAAVRSAIAPGWGQAFNGEGVKAVIFGVGTYTSLAVTAGLGLGAGFSWASYQNFTKADGQTPEEAGAAALALRNQTNGLLTATAVAGAVSASVWSLNVVDALLDAPPEG